MNFSNINDREELIRKDKAHVWHPFTQMYEYEREEPLIIA